MKTKIVAALAALTLSAAAHAGQWKMVAAGVYIDPSTVMINGVRGTLSHYTVTSCTARVMTEIRSFMNIKRIIGTVQVLATPDGTDPSALVLHTWLGEVSKSDGSGTYYIGNARLLWPPQTYDLLEARDAIFQTCTQPGAKMAPGLLKMMLAPQPQPQPPAASGSTSSSADSSSSDSDTEAQAAKPAYPPAVGRVPVWMLVGRDAHGSFWVDIANTQLSPTAPHGWYIYAIGNQGRQLWNLVTRLAAQKGLDLEKIASSSDVGRETQLGTEAIAEMGWETRYFEINCAANTFNDNGSTVRERIYPRSLVAKLEFLVCRPMPPPAQAVSSSSDESSASPPPAVGDPNCIGNGPICRDFPNTDDYYPKAAQRLGEQGAVQVRTCVGPAGTLTGPPEIVKSSGFPELDKGAFDLAQAGNGKYRPGAGCFTWQVTFTFR